MVTAEENRRGVRDFVFVVTDGISNDDVVQPARRLREYGVTVNTALFLVYTVVVVFRLF